MSCTGMHLTLSEQRPASRSSLSGQAEVFYNVLARPEYGEQWSCCGVVEHGLFSPFTQVELPGSGSQAAGQQRSG